MKNLTRIEVKKAFQNIVKEFGKPNNGTIYCENQLIAEIANNLCCYDETNIVYENGGFKVSPHTAILNKYPKDYTFIGTVKANEWYTAEQIKAMHEIGFGYQF